MFSNVRSIISVHPTSFKYISDWGESFNFDSQWVPNSLITILYIWWFTLLHRQVSRYTWNLLFIFSLASGLDTEGHMCNMGQALAQWVGKNFRKSLTPGDLATTSLYVKATENHINISHWTKLKVFLSLHPLSNNRRSSGRDKVTWPQAKSEREKAVLLIYCG